MIRAIFRVDSSGQPTGLTVTGHDLTAPKGMNTVCAAVSAMLDLTALGIIEELGIQADYQVGDGHMTLNLPADSLNHPEACFMLRTIKRSLERVGEQYQVRVLLEE